MSTPAAASAATNPPPAAAKAAVVVPAAPSVAKPGAPAAVVVTAAAAPTAPAAAAPNVLANRPGEPQFQMKLEPEKLVFKGDGILEKPVDVELKLTNTTKKRQSYKTRCTSNDLFRVRPPLGYIAPDETAVIRVAFVGKAVPEANKHFLAFYHMPSEETKQPARAIWTAASKPEGVKRVGCFFENDDGTPHPSAPAAK